MLVTVRRGRRTTDTIEVLGPLDTERIELGPAIERKIDEIDFFKIDRNLASETDPPDARDVSVTVETDEPRIHGVSYVEGSEAARNLGVTALVDLIDSTGEPTHEVTFDSTGHEVPVHPETKFDCSKWAAWYNREPGGQYDPNLHVTGECTFPVGGVKLTLEPGNVGVAPQPGLIALELTAEFPDIATQVVESVSVSWEGDVGPDVEHVRIQGDADADIDVTIAE
jgi:hypothetical protein